MNVILIAVIILGVVGLVASIMLYAASKKFAVVLCFYFILRAISTEIP